MVLHLDGAEKAYISNSIILSGARSSMAEHAAHNRLVDGSNPSGPTKYWLMAPSRGGIRIHPGPLNIG